MIRNVASLFDKDMKIRMLIYGIPCVGKTSLALSAPKPLLVDVEHGVQRTDPQYRKYSDGSQVDCISPDSYQDILNDLTPENVAPYETIVFDTGGKLINLIGEWAIQNNPKCGQTDGSLTQKGYGVVGREFMKLFDYCHYDLKKNVVIVFHAKETIDGDVTKIRLKAEGQTKDNVWEPMDLGGLMEMQGNDRTISFSSCDRYYAKGTRGINGIYKIPEVGRTEENNFLTKLFDKYKKSFEEDLACTGAEKEAYEATMDAAKKMLDLVKDAATANIAIDAFKELDHHLTSKKEVGAMWKAKMKDLGLVLDPDANQYRSAEA